MLSEQVTADDLGSNITWSGAKAEAAKRGLRLARSHEVVQLLTERGWKPLTAVDGKPPEKNMWAPVGDAPNEWMYIGDWATKELGKTYKAIHGKQPDWGEEAASSSLFTSGGNRGCVIMMPLDAAVGSSGSKTAAAAAPVAAAAAGGVAATGKPAPSAAARVAAAPTSATVPAGPRVAELGGATTWTAAKDTAAKQGKRLATQAEVQAYIKSKGGKPLKADDAWVPVSDAPNEWVSVGGKFPDRLGKTHTQVAGSKPGWNTEAGVQSWRGLMLMC